MIAPGVVCYKTAGRDAGMKVVVMSVKGSFAEVLGLRKTRKVSLKHLEPTSEKVDTKLKEDALLKYLDYTRKEKKEKKGEK
jgi:ribosomal protein L14E/L6E/L27E